ncbi:MAG: outer membrane lipoprotein-sorting protein [Candidatus Marinimicrobia bacterium]|nr:outer membrane lipoprotein-sorting protein [Candidatus Neomarinimicrobiota bacterium]
MKKIMTFGIIIIFSSLLMAQTPSAEEILNKIDENMVIDQAISTSKMVIHGRVGDRTIESKSWSKGNDLAMVEYLSPPREAGTKMLKTADKLWIYTPEPTDRIITISGHLLRQSVMGSDLSYEDITDNSSMIECYNAEILGTETIRDRECWVLELTAKKDDISYYSRKIWVDTERLLPLKEERFAKSGKLLKKTEILEVFKQDGRWYPKHMIFKDMLSRGKGTEYFIESIDFDVDIPEYKFTKAALRR